jgi:hypothetical protein
MKRKRKRYRFLTRLKRSVTPSQSRCRLRNARFISTLGTKIQIRMQRWTCFRNAYHPKLLTQLTIGVLLSKYFLMKRSRLSS